MENLQHCVDVLRHLIKENNLNGIGLAERAIDEFCAKSTPTVRENGLRHMSKTFQKDRDPSTGYNPEFAETVNAYIASKLRETE